MSDLYPQTPQHDAEHTQVNLTVAADIPAPPPIPAPLPRKHLPVNYVSAPPRPKRIGVMLIAAFVLFALMGVTAVGAAWVLTSTNPVYPTPTPINLAALPTPVDARVRYDAVTPLPTGVPVNAGEPTLIESGAVSAWNGGSRLTVLVMGLDRRPGYTGLGYRTDSMMLVSVDPETGSAGILSIPRDLYVNVPGYAALQRINTPMVLGEYESAGGGPALAVETVQYNFGIRVHHYLVVDFEAVIALIDAIGGIEINVPYAIADYAFPDMADGYDPLVLNAGLQRMDGATALKYARTRHSDSDFQRAERQQQVVFAVRDRALTDAALPGLIARAPALYGSVRRNISTDFTLDQLIQLAMIAKDIPASRIRTGVIGVDYVMGYTTEDGAQVLVPNRAMLPDLFADVFGADYGE